MSHGILKNLSTTLHTQFKYLTRVQTQSLKSYSIVHSGGEMLQKFYSKNSCLGTRFSIEISEALNNRINYFFIIIIIFSTCFKTTDWFTLEFLLQSLSTNLSYNLIQNMRLSRQDLWNKNWLVRNKKKYVKKPETRVENFNNKNIFIICWTHKMCIKMLKNF